MLPEAPPLLIGAEVEVEDGTAGGVAVASPPVEPEPESEPEPVEPVEPVPVEPDPLP